MDPDKEVAVYRGQGAIIGFLAATALWFLLGFFGVTPFVKLIPKSDPAVPVK